jgi:hypothetical protein
MPLHEGSTRRFITAAEVVLQQLPIGQPCGLLPKNGAAKVLDDPADLAHHYLTSRAAAGVHFYPNYYRLRPV